MIFDFNELNKIFSADNWLRENFGCEFINGNNGWINSSCPFDDHQDSNPSFGINLEKGRYNCFGCSREGDFINLVESLTGVKFIHAVSIMAEYSGINIGNYDSLKFKNEKFKKALIEENEKLNENQRLIMKATVKIKNIMKKDFEKADQMYKTLDRYINEENFIKVKEIANGDFR